MIAAIDTEALFELMWAAPLAVGTVTIAYGLVVIGSVRAAEASREGRTGAAGVYAALAIAGAALFAAAVVFGLIVMISKD
jgi:hypothetical protein